MLEIHQNLRKLRKKLISRKSCALKGGTTLNPSTLWWDAGTIVPQNNSLFEMFWSCLGLFNDKCWNVMYEKKM